MANTPNRNWPLPALSGTLHDNGALLIAVLGLIDGDMQAAFSALAGKADLSGAAFTTSPTAPTPASGDDSNKLATTAFVKAAQTIALANFIGAAPAALDTWMEMVAEVQANESGLGALTAVVGNKANSADVYTKAQMDAALAASWAFQPIGVPIPLADHLAGVAAPPTNQAYRYVKLTAGLTGAGGYNNGVLGSESVSGSAPGVQATGVITLSLSPMNGQTIRLINTERRFIRAYDTSGTVMDDAMQLITGSFYIPSGALRSPKVGAFTTSTSAYGSTSSYPSYPANAPGDLVDFNSSNSPSARTDTETRGKFIGETYFMRIK